MGNGTDWANKMKAKMKAALENSDAVFLAATGTMVQIADRVWGKGGLTAGGTIQYNEDYEVYTYKPPFPRNGTGKGKPNKEGKSRKIKGGWHPTYLAAKTSQERGDKPFELSGKMFRSWSGGGTLAPKKEGPYRSVIRVDDLTAKKIKGLTATKGAFLSMNAEERAGYRRRLIQYMQDAR